MNLQHQLQHIIEQLSSRGFETRKLVFAPPCKLVEVQTLEKALRFPLPPSFRETLLTISGHVEFRWFAPRTRQFPPPFHDNFSGDLHWSAKLVRSINHAKNNLVNDVFTDLSYPYNAVWQSKLAFSAIPNGDYLAIDLAPKTYEQIVYLSHDDSEGHGYVLAENFQELLRRWVPLACPGGEDWQWLPFTNNATTPIDPNCPNATRWCELLQIAA